MNDDLRLIGDTLYFEGQAVAVLVKSCAPTLMDRFKSLLKRKIGI